MRRSPLSPASFEAHGAIAQDQYPPTKLLSNDDRSAEPGLAPGGNLSQHLPLSRCSSMKAAIIQEAVQRGGDEVDGLSRECGVLVCRNIRTSPYHFDDKQRGARSGIDVRSASVGCSSERRRSRTHCTDP